MSIFISVSIVFLSVQTIEYANANSITITLPGDGNALNVLQDGIDNTIDLTTNYFEDGDMEIKQNGNYNSVDLNISGGTGTGSSFYIYQYGDNNNYGASLYCGAEWCTMTVTQP